MRVRTAALNFMMEPLVVVGNAARGGSERSPHLWTKHREQASPTDTELQIGAQLAHNKRVLRCTFSGRDPDAFSFKIFSDGFHSVFSAQTRPLHATKWHHVA